MDKLKYTVKSLAFKPFLNGEDLELEVKPDEFVRWGGYDIVTPPEDINNGLEMMIRVHPPGEGPRYFKIRVSEVF